MSPDQTRETDDAGRSIVRAVMAAAPQAPEVAEIGGGPLHAVRVQQPRASQRLMMAAAIAVAIGGAASIWVARGTETGSPASVGAADSAASGTVVEPAVVPESSSVADTSGSAAETTAAAEVDQGPTEPKPSDDPTLPAVGSAPSDERPPWLSADGQVDRSLMPVFTSVAKDGIVVGYVLTANIYAPPPPPGQAAIDIPIVDVDGNQIGHVSPDGLPILEP